MLCMQLHDVCIQDIYLSLIILMAIFPVNLVWPWFSSSSCSVIMEENLWR